MPREVGNTIHLTGIATKDIHETQNRRNVQQFTYTARIMRELSKNLNSQKKRKKVTDERYDTCTPKCLRL